MDNEKANRFVASLVKSIQALCNGYIDFSSSIEVVGHIHLNIDRNVKLNYVLTEEVSKSETEGSTVFASHSYHSQHPSSLSSKAKKSDNFSHHSRQKSQQSDEIDPLNFTSIPPEVHNISNSDLSRGQSTVCLTESGNHGDNVLSVKLENSSSSSQKHESLDRRRKNLEFERTASPPAAKRHRNSSRPKPAEENFEVIEIKEEPDDDLSVSFGDADAHMAVGQDLHTPDFSNVVMESLDRVGKVEGSQLVGGSEDLQMHHQKAPFPVMMHASGTVPSTSVSSIMDPVPGLSSEHQAVASTDEAPEGQFDRFAHHVPAAYAVEDVHQRDEICQDMTDLSLHVLEKGEGKNHRCIVCQRRHSQYLKDHPGTLPASNPFKRSKTSFRCSLCKVYLCAQEERHCWLLWHDTEPVPSVHGL